VPAIETTGSGLIAALEQTWADIRHRTPELPEVVVVTGTGLSSTALHIDAKWGHFGADHWVQGRPTEEGQGAALDLSAARRRHELFVAGECLAEGPARPSRPCCTRPSTPWPMPAGSRTPPGVASTTTSARSSPSPANSAWPGPKASGRIRSSVSPKLP
jgi:hypothetical protein